MLLELHHNQQQQQQQNPKKKKRTRKHPPPPPPPKETQQPQIKTKTKRRHVTGKITKYNKSVGQTRASQPTNMATHLQRLLNLEKKNLVVFAILVVTVVSDGAVPHAELTLMTLSEANQRPWFLPPHLLSPPPPPPPPPVPQAAGPRCFW